MIQAQPQPYQSAKLQTLKVAEGCGRVTLGKCCLNTL